MPLILPYIPVIQNTSLPAATVGTPYTATVVAVSGVQPLTYAITSDSPNTGNWLSINPATGVLSGTPTTAETESVTIVATDALGQLSAPSNFILTVQPTIIFDFFISPTGVDTNPGTLAQPWSLSAFNSKFSTYNSKKIGLIGDQGKFQFSNTGSGQVSLYAQMNVNDASGVGVCFQIQGGTGDTNRTFIASCNSSGAYVPRLAVIDFSDPATGALSLNATRAGFGQTTSSPAPAPTQWGNITFDGLVMAYAASSAIHIRPPFNRCDNVTIQNCECYAGGQNNRQIVTNGNPAVLKFTQSTGMNNLQILNNKVHDYVGLSGGSSQPWHFPAVEFNAGAPTFNPIVGVVVKNNTFYNIGVGVSFKDTNVSASEIAYNYLDGGYFGNPGLLGSGNAHSAYLMLTDATHSHNFHHNICLTNFDNPAAEATVPSNTGQVFVRNNTFYDSTAALAALRIGSDAGGLVTFQHNIVYSTVGYSSGNPQGCIQINAGTDPASSGIFGMTPASCNNNWYGSGIQFQNGKATTLFGIATWRAAPFGFDVNTVIGTSSPFLGIPAAVNMASFASSVTSGDGLICGAVGADGLASDGSGNSIGCNF